MLAKFFAYLGAEPVRVFWFIFIFMLVLMLIELAGKKPYFSFYLACGLVQLTAWLILKAHFEWLFFQNNGWVILLGIGVALWFLMPLLKREISRGDGGGITVVEEEFL